MTSNTTMIFNDKIFKLQKSQQSTELVDNYLRLSQYWRLDEFYYNPIIYQIPKTFIYYEAYSYVIDELNASVETFDP